MTEGSAASAPIPSAPRKRGIFYIKWGPTDAILQRSINSVRAVHPELPIYVRKLPDNATLLEKSAMMKYTPFEETLYLDIDTVVMDRMDFGFEMAVRHGLACCICECPWARRYNGIRTGDLIEYNTGVMFFTKKARPIFDAWMSKAAVTDSSVAYYGEDGNIKVMPFNDQAAFALAVAEIGMLPAVPPLNWNFRPKFHGSFFGPLKVWHDYNGPPEHIVNFSKAQSLPDAVFSVCHV